jgi:hypothetical protein
MTFDIIEGDDAALEKLTIEQIATAEPRYSPSVCRAMARFWRRYKAPEMAMIAPRLAVLWEAEAAVQEHLGTPQAPSAQRGS